MPWHVTKQDNQFCVVKDSDNATVACHDTEDAAKAQLAALYASERAVHAYERAMMANSAHFGTPSLDDARRFLDAAIARHERHMSGTEPTSAASQQQMMDEMRSARAALGGAHPGALLAFLLDDATRQALIDACAPLEVTPDHVTLVYLGPEATAMDAHKSALIRMIADTACYTSPIEGTVNGFGRFQAGEGEDTSALYASIDCPALPLFRQRLWDAACMAGCEPMAEHGFVPHATLAYLPAGDATPSLDIPAIPLRFTSFALVWGAETITFPFSEDMYMAEEYRNNPLVDASFLLAETCATLRRSQSSGIRAN